jgi:hypothetical protein
MTTLTQKKATDGQKKQLIRMATDAAEKAARGYTDAGYLSKEGAERVKGNPDFVARIHAATVLAFAELSRNDKFKAEEVKSSYDYLSGYKPKQLADQVAHLKGLYTELKDAEVTDPGELPKGAEGRFALPNIWKDGLLLTGNYNDNVVDVLGRISRDRNGKFYNYRDDQLGPDRLRQSAATEAAMRKLSEEQGHPDILVIAAQFGKEHRGRSVPRALEVMIDQRQYGLGTFAIGVMLLTHPERLQHYDDLWIDCAGDEFDDPVSDVRFGHAPFFGVYDGEVWFGARLVGDAHGHFGSVSGFLPQ